MALTEVTSRTLAGTMDLNLNVGFSTSGSLISKIVRWFTRSKISHSFMAIDLFGARIIVGAEGYGLDWSTKRRFEKDSVIVAVYKPVALPVDSAFAWFVQQFAGADYDYMAAGAIGIMHRLKLIWMFLKNVLIRSTSPKKLICSEAVIRLLKEAGYNSVKDCNPELTDADDLWKIIDASPEYKLVFKAPGY